MTKAQVLASRKSQNSDRGKHIPLGRNRKYMGRKNIDLRFLRKKLKLLREELENNS